MSAAGSFQEARDGLRQARLKLDAIDHVLGLMQTLADSIRHHGEVPELVYDRETGTASLHVRVGRVPPKVSVTMEAAEQPKPSLGDLSDRMQGLEVSGAAEISAVEPSPVRLEELRMPAPEPGATRLTLHKAGEWTAEEERRLLKLHDDGMDLSVMALTLNRRGAGVAAKLRSLLAKRAIPSARAVAARATEAPPPKPGPVVPPPSTGPILPPGQGRPRLEREAEARLEAAASDDWPAARDLDLVERMARGDGAGGTAAAMEIVKDAVLARWRQLFPTPPTLEEQAAMLAVLRARVHSQGE